MDLKYLLKKLEKYDPNVLQRVYNVYQWGSRVYGTNTETSDWDFVITVSYSFPSDNCFPILPKEAISSKEKNFPAWVYEIYKDEEINATLIDISKFQRMVIEHRLEILEAIFLPDKNKWQEKHKVQFDFDKDVLRRSTYWEAMRTWNKAKRKIPTNFNKGRKELFHALRYLHFAIQIAKYNKIVDYSEANHLWNEIKQEESIEWSFFNAKYRPKFNNLLHIFKSLTSTTHIYTSRETRVPDIISGSVPCTFPSIETPSSDCPKNFHLSNVAQFIKKFGTEKLMEVGISIFKSGTLLFLSNNICNFEKVKKEHPELLELCVECSGIILDEENGFQVISWPHKKFFNLFETENIVNKNPFPKGTRVYEKLNGISCTMYYYKGSWQISSKTPTGIELVCFKEPSSKTTISALFWDIWKKIGYQIPSDVTKCYMFEVMTNRHRRVVNNKRETILLHGVRDLVSLQEIEIQPIAKQYGWEEVPLITQFVNMEELVENSKTLNPFITEGYVVCDENFNRMKISAPMFISLCYLGFNNGSMVNGLPSLNAEEVDEKYMLDMVRHGEAHEFCTYFPKWKALKDDLEVRFNKFLKEVNEFYKSICNLQTAEFAKKATETKYSRVLIYVHIKKTSPSIEQFLSTCYLEYLCELLEVHIVKPTKRKK